MSHYLCGTLLLILLTLLGLDILKALAHTWDVFFSDGQICFLLELLIIYHM